MSIGSFVRFIFGKKIFSRVAKIYRFIFVDLEKVSLSISEYIAANENVYDIGGGDGELLNCLMRIRGDISITMIDISKSIGNSIQHCYQDRIRRYPGMSVFEYAKMSGEEASCILISDVMHHIPFENRKHFIGEIKGFLAQDWTVIIKDVEPGFFRSRLSYIADRYISGDKNTSLISRKELVELIRSEIGEVSVIETDLFDVDFPNFAIIFQSKD